MCQCLYISNKIRLQGVWGNGMHQQRISNLANGLPSVNVSTPSIAAAENAGVASTPSMQGREAVPSSSRSAGSTSHVRESLSSHGHSPFDGAPVFSKQRQRIPHNASAQELNQTGGNSEGFGSRRERGPKLSLDSLTSQRPAEQVQQALANFDLQAEDFPALGGMGAGPSLAGMPSLAKGRTVSGKAWSETDAISPPVKAPL